MSDVPRSDLSTSAVPMQSQASPFAGGRAMQRVKVCLSILGMVAAVAAGVQGLTQTRGQDPDRKSRIAAHSITLGDLLPFALGATPQNSSEEIGFRAAREMIPEDGQLVSDRWSAIEKKAFENGFNLNKKHWKFEQIVNPAFPDHVLLLFLKDGPPDELSEFSAIVCRTGTEPVLVIPILRRGYLPYSASQEDPVAMAAFNRLLATERTHGKPYWLWVSSGYAALNGDHAILSTADAEVGQQGSTSWLAPPVPSLSAMVDGGAVARFAVQKSPGTLDGWELTFDKSGSLINVRSSPIKALNLKVVTPAKLKSRRY